MLNFFSSDSLQKLDENNQHQCPGQTPITISQATASIFSPKLLRRAAWRAHKAKALEGDRVLSLAEKGKVALHIQHKGLLKTKLPPSQQVDQNLL